MSLRDPAVLSVLKHLPKKPELDFVTQLSSNWHKMNQREHGVEVSDSSIRQGRAEIHLTSWNDPHPQVHQKNVS